MNHTSFETCPREFGLLDGAHPQAGPAPAPDSRAVALALRGVTKSYDGRAVLHGLDLDIGAGEFIAVVGRSGCGKSTLLRLIAGLEAADSGGIACGPGARAGAMNAGATVFAHLRIMFQEPRLLPWKTVLENVGLGLERQARSRATQALERVGLLQRAGEWPAVLSGGQRQRVALARALVHAPAMLLLDEPLGALDALTRLEMQQLIEALWKERGFTALLVTHDVQEAVSLADRVLLVEDGRIVLDQRIDLPRPRHHADPGFAQLEADLLERLLKRS
jgi:sulfonate transport system ATP-binding protein